MVMRFLPAGSVWFLVVCILVVFGACCLFCFCSKFVVFHITGSLKAAPILHLTGVMWPCVSFRCGDRRRHSWLRRDKGAVLAVVGSRRDPWPGRLIYI